MESGDARGMELFGEIEHRTVRRAQFTAHIGNLERQRPFLTVAEAERALQALGEPRYMVQSVARSWIAVPLAVRLAEAGRLREEVAIAARLGREARDDAVVLLAEWGTAVHEARMGASHGVDRVWDVVRRLAAAGRAYTAWRLGVDAAHGLVGPLPWARDLGELLASGGALTSAKELRVVTS